MLKNKGREPADFTMRANKVVVSLNILEDGSFSLTFDFYSDNNRETFKIRHKELLIDYADGFF